jgi:hypothetical protein
MSFKENLLKKIQIDTVTREVLASVGPPDSGIRVDKDAMVRLLAFGSYKALKERDLDLYILEGDANRGKILVLDNDLAIYHTSAHDIGLRKSPTVGEMVRIRNIKKILVDSDVVISKKEESVEFIRKECIDMLDLSFEVTDIETIADEGAAALETGNNEGVRESLTLFADLLDYRPAPKPFKLAHYEIMGKLSQSDNTETLLGPVVIYGSYENSLKLLEATVGSFDKKNIELIHQVAKGNENASAEGSDVLQYLKAAVIRTKN